MAMIITLQCCISSISGCSKNVKFSHVFLSLSLFQAQFNGIRKRAPGDSGITNTFTTAYNCEGYFSVGSWMGSFTVVILLLILYVAVVFMFGMKTIDRFDDPRGPTITVENLH